MDWSITPISEIEKYLKTSTKVGINENEVARRQKDGSNTQYKKQPHSILDSVINQIKDPVVYILLIAGIFTVIIQHFGDAVIIFFTLGINFTLGMFQEWKANSAFQKISDLQKKEAIVIRNGIKRTIASEDLVVGDLVTLNAGNFVPADLRLVDTKDLSINESILTGEWEPQKKSNVCLSSEKNIFDKINMAWQGTTIQSGEGLGIVVRIGSDTELGQISESLMEKKEDTYLRKSTKKIAKFMTILILVVILIIFALSAQNNIPLVQSIILVIAIAVSALPSGLPATVTFILALAMERILKKGGLLKNLLSAESLGSTTTIITDKTGTITEAKMEMSGIVDSNGCFTSIKDTNYESFNSTKKEIIVTSILSTNAEKIKVPNDTAKYTGTPIEQGIYIYGEKINVTRESIKTKFKRERYIPFSSKRRVSVSINTVDNKKFAYISGSPEYLLSKSKYHINQDGVTEELTQEAEEKVNSLLSEYTAQGARSFGLAIKELKGEIEDYDLDKLTLEILEGSRFLGFVIFKDPIRKNINKSIKNIKSSGVNIILATGDAPGTALYVAKETDIANNGKYLTGTSVEKMSDIKIYDEYKGGVRVFARMLPNQKLRLLKILSNKGENIAMTGDGVNDVPALHHAQIGIALGSGTDIAKDASDLVLINNSFSIIVDAIEEGRRIIRNLRRVVIYLLATSFSEIWLIGASFVIGAPLPLLPSQILWANVIEESIIGITFAFEKGEIDKKAKRDIFTSNTKKLIVIISLATGIVLTSLFIYLTTTDMAIEQIRSILFLTLSLSAILFALALKNVKKPIWKINLFDNKYLLISISISLLFLFMAFNSNILVTLLDLTPLSIGTVLIIFGIAILNLMIIEIIKYFVLIRK